MSNLRPCRSRVWEVAYDFIPCPQIKLHLVYDDPRRRRRPEPDCNLSELAEKRKPSYAPPCSVFLGSHLRSTVLRLSCRESFIFENRKDGIPGAVCFYPMEGTSNEESIRACVEVSYRLGNITVVVIAREGLIDDYIAIYSLAETW